MKKADYETLVKRIGRLHLRQRLDIQEDHASQAFGQGTMKFHIENLTPLHVLLEKAFRLICLYGRAKENIYRLELRTNDIVLHRLPASFENFTILHLSDLHIDFEEHLIERIIEQVRDLSYDICVWTGDYRALTYGPFDKAVGLLRTLLDHIHQPVYAVLGNHDFIELGLELEKYGVHLLLNESVVLTRGHDNLAITGIDDPHFYAVDNLEKAADKIQHDICTVLLSHTSEIARKAYYCGVDLVLCGHTHGGQLCMPGGIPIIGNVKSKRSMIRGNWQYRDRLKGYTSAGCGISSVPLRLNCPPEITLHRLQRRNPQGAGCPDTMP